jgi:hypothetical protein
MIHTRLVKLLSLIVFPLLFSLYGCNSKYQKPTDEILQKVELSSTLTVVPIITVTPTKITSKSSTLTPTQDLMLLPTIEQSPFYTNTPTNKPSSTWTTIPTVEVAPTLTNLPTLSQDNADAMVMDLLPCWWGLTSGETTWEMARQFLSTFATEVGNGIRIPVKIDGKNDPVTGYRILFKIPNLLTYGEINFFVTEDSIYKIFIDYIGTDISYQLHQFMTTYGEPDEIWLQGWPYNEEHVQHYALLIIYHEGILARYEGIATSPDINLRMCPQQAGPRLVLWNSKYEQKDFTNLLIQNENDLWGAPEFKPLQEATTMDIASFYQLMQDPNACFETPLSLWDNRDFGITATPTPGK